MQATFAIRAGNATVHRALPVMVSRDHFVSMPLSLRETPVLDSGAARV